MQPLSGIRVLDLTRALAGPYCTMMLGDLGADVIKVERPGIGDETRGWGPPFVGKPYGPYPGESAYFLAANRNKRGITVNLHSPEGLEVIHRLASVCDVLIENFRTGALQELGLGYDELHAGFPRLIYCSVSGYGRTGPLASRPGYDAVLQAEGGIMSITGPADGPASRVGIPIIDITSGMFASTAVLAALHARESTGEGQFIDISLFDSHLALLSNAASNYLVGNREPRRMGNAHPNLAPYGVFQARDAAFVLGVANDQQWKLLCNVLARPDLAEHPKFATNADRVANRAALEAELTTAFSQRDATDWLASLVKAGLPCGRINSLKEVFDLPHTAARDMVIQIEHPTAGPVRMTGFPYKLDRTPPALRLPPPMLGEHTDLVLTELLKYPPDEVAALREREAI